MRERFLLHLLLLLSITAFTFTRPTSASSTNNNGNGYGGVGTVGGRYSFSLTTFSPSGKLQQVEHAIRASELGTPVLAVSLHGTVILASPHAVPTPLVHDDGTQRFTRITSDILVAHSGVSADGRAVVAAAQRLAVEYAYTYDEEIPVESLLREVSSLFQAYTMKAGARPFGCCLLVAHVDRDVGSSLFRVDPSGSVECMGDVALIGKGVDVSSVSESLRESGIFELESPDEASDLLAMILKREMDSYASKSTPHGASGSNAPRLTFITATLS